MAGKSKGCTNFSDLVVDDNIALEEIEVFFIFVGSSMAKVKLEDDDGTYK